ncbi:MAG: phenylalanine--tRNA ligase subunit beta [Saprospiraceae bacterium]|nr:phenylalanine--tRNA ligase subunit beta [Saprospiraceae bacterium]
MKISYNWISNYIDLQGISIEALSDILTTLGLEVASVEKTETIKGGLKGVMVGEVIEAKKHPNADKLSVTKVDIGKERLLDIVCGAPNVAAGQKVLVATPGTIIYGKNDEKFEIKKGVIRGLPSEGMICAEDELGIGEDHTGIIVLPAETKTGMPAKDYFRIEEDYVFEIELTPNRSDATSHIGVARDLAAYLKINHGHTGQVNLPDISDFGIDNNDKSISVIVENSERCPRYSGLTLTDLQIKESPSWLKNRLLSIGARPINNIVDITNFVLHELGQPLHAFDAEKISGNTLRIKTLKKDTSFVTLDETVRKLREEDLMICDDKSSPLCLGGVFGGLESGVSDSTTSIFLESAYFNPKSIRLSSMKHNLRTDAALIFEKGADPDMSLFALKRAAMLIRELAGAKISSEITDIYPVKIELAQVEIKYKNVNRLIGIDLDNEEVKKILHALSFRVISETDISVIVEIPGNKYDVTREADVIEEILRIYGLNKVPIPAKVAISVNLTETKEKYKVRNYLSEYLSNQGFYEAMSLSLTESEKYNRLLEIDNDKYIYINNTSNVNLNIMRPEMMLCGLENLRFNLNRQNRDIPMYEFGRSYQYSGQEIKEREYLSFYMTGKKFDESWNADNNKKFDFYSLKAHVDNIFAKLNLSKMQTSAIEIDNRFDYGIQVMKGNLPLGSYGKVNPELANGLDVKQEVFYCELDLDNLIKFSESKMHVEEISKFPTSRRDVALVIDKKIRFEDIEKTASKILKKILKSVNLFDVYKNDEQLGKDKISYAISLVFEDKTRTLQDKEIEKELGKFLYVMENEYGAKIRK